MRIVGGRWRGRALAPVGKGDAGAHLRPTTDRVRESLFNVLEHGAFPPFEGARVLDLFAGTGALGLEALSRGAEHATFVDKGGVAQKLIRKNVELLGCAGTTKLLRADGGRLGQCRVPPFDMLFADPPYNTGMGPRAILGAIEGGWLAPDALVVVEEGSEIDLPGVEIQDIRRYGDTVIYIGTVTAR